ncbi:MULTISPECIES: Holliday junction branch migration protein RuvA [Nocardiopsis]|uniref:Holliday junction branch migration complex subunit RuvA n=1 Tax=Nocardiopsis dassonvillei (strain ATCC 23218 / DSM 43111 / CIP 107115 / JCM 7437 / KCTC 9190 / NBRC 14626 / NCTC 10488 / NRRL B-5397 / IMRU 509) TaxID=446468 RepID=D7AZJ0_NOCDD|nr:MULTISPECIES: Holliday junction branch migration protein RuvA [Nocardiopsis]ADH66282.1 Holliday junction DNA helicase RuvA [Nocardiopsis dassonvillei subsp. dassonvillei DSM 43111]NKY79102.1 Holliday junction branch migration protein RuvA [Nocardiopsis dassonvillei]VEI92304.1 Holliday junction ATP-dependent DNA helicase RuvA [Nocardiopsis dassonvillei]
MIAFLTGRVAARGAGTAVIDVGGVGMTVQCTPSALSRLHVGETGTVATSLVVREESLTLFGFADDDEKHLFEQLQTASGVGPRLALAMLSVHSPSSLRHAVSTEDTTALTRVPGIGKKGAQRIVLELRGKLDAPVLTDGTLPGSEAAGTGSEPNGAWRGQVVSGLVNLGWSAKDAEAAASAVAAEAEHTDDVAVLLRSALRRLSRA